MVFMQRWLTFMLLAIVFQFSYVTLTRTDGTQNATAA